jgi:hypothetical protein
MKKNDTWERGIQSQSKNCHGHSKCPFQCFNFMGTYAQPQCLFDLKLFSNLKNVFFEIFIPLTVFFRKNVKAQYLKNHHIH